MQISDYTGNPLANVQKGYDFSQGLQNDFAQKQAGNLLAQTASPAAAPLFQTGQLDAGSKVQNYTQDQQKQVVADHLAFLGKAADALSKIPDTDGRQTARRQALAQHVAPALLQMGYKPQDIAQIQNGDLSDQGLGMFQTQVKQQLEKVGNNIVAVDPNTLKSSVVYQGEPDQPKHDWKEVTNADGSTSFIDLNAYQPGPQAAPAAPAGSTGIDPGLDKLTGAGVTVTSAFRTPQKNSDVGGVANSHHLTGQAVDLVPPKGMSMVQLAALAQQSVPGAKVINEGDHVHVQWGTPQAAPQGAPGRIPGSAPGTKDLKGKEADDAALSPDAVKLLAGKYLANGQLPPMGMGKQGQANRNAILNEATTQAKALGLDANDLVAGTASVKATGQALTKLVGMRSQITASEQTVLKNADYALSLAPKGGGPTGVPVLNRWIQAGRKNIAGDPDVAAFDNAVRTVADEYAKVMTTNTGSGGGATSDSARQEAYRRLDSAASPAQLQSVIAAMKMEMANRVQSLNEVESKLRSDLRGGPAAGGAPAAPAAPSGGWGKAVVVR